MKSFTKLMISNQKTGIWQSCCRVLSLAFIIPFLLFAGAVSAQTIKQSLLNCADQNRCTSKDLSVVSVAIDAPACLNCTGGQVTFPLKMTINNGTGSVRTSFSLYGTLSNGASINGVSGKIFICVGPITVTKGIQTFNVGNITFNCGQELALTNNFLAWTDASGNTTDRCNTYSQATTCADIAPKCGTAASITIVGPVSAPTLDKVDPTCTVSTGKVTVTSSTTGFTFSLDGAAFESYPSGGWTASPGQHCVRAKRTSDGCISSQTCITIPAQPSTPARPVVTLQEATICGSLAAPTITVSCPIAGTYTLTQTGVAGSQTKTYPAVNPVVFTVVAGKQFSITVTNTDGCTSAATNCTNYNSNSCPSAAIVSKAAEQPIELVAPKTSVLAAPNPFNDRIRFTLKSNVSGQGSLELFNMLGQRVKTVFHGYVNADQPQSVEYAVPYSQRANMIYLFRVGNEKTSGKLVGLR